MMLFFTTIVVILYFLAIWSFHIQKKVNLQYIKFLGAFRFMLTETSSRNKLLQECQYSKEEIVNKPLIKDVSRLVNAIYKYQLITGDQSEDVNKMLSELYKGNYVNENDLFIFNAKIIKIMAVLKRKHKYLLKESLAPWNLINNVLDIFIYYFTDYEYYFLQPKTVRKKKIISGISGFLSAIYVLLSYFTVYEKYLYTPLKKIIDSITNF